MEMSLAYAKSDSGPSIQETSDFFCFFFSCIAGRVRDMVGQLLEIRVGLKAN